MRYSDSREKVYQTVLKSPVPISTANIAENARLSVPTVNRRLSELELMSRVRKVSTNTKAFYYEAFERDEPTKAAKNPVVATLSWPISWKDGAVNKEMTVYEVITKGMEAGIVHKALRKSLVGILVNAFNDELDDNVLDDTIRQTDNAISMGESNLKSLRSFRALMELFKVTGIKTVVLDEDPYADDEKLMEVLLSEE